MQHLYFTTQRLISFRKKISVFPKFPSYPPRFLRTKLRWKKKILEVVLRYGFEKCFEICFSVVPYLSVWFGYKKKVFYFFFSYLQRLDVTHGRRAAPLLYYTTISTSTLLHNNLTCSAWMSHTADEPYCPSSPSLQISGNISSSYFFIIWFFFWEIFLEIFFSCYWHTCAPVIGVNLNRPLFINRSLLPYSHRKGLFSHLRTPVRCNWRQSQ